MEEFNKKKERVNISLDYYEELINKAFITNSLLTHEHITNKQIDWINYLLYNFKNTNNHITHKEKHAIDTLIVVATDEEYELAQKRFIGYDIIKTGVGGLNVINKLKDISRDTKIINFGYVGSNCIAEGTEVTIGYSRMYHPNVKYDEPIYRLYNDSEITCFTSNDFVLKTDVLKPAVFDMELAYIFALGFKQVSSIKIVSDKLSLKEYNKTVNIK